MTAWSAPIPTITARVTLARMRLVRMTAVQERSEIPLGSVLTMRWVAIGVALRVATLVQSL
jgi:hypothetical protein